MLHNDARYFFVITVDCYAESRIIFHAPAAQAERREPCQNFFRQTLPLTGKSMIIDFRAIRIRIVAGIEMNTDKGIRTVRFRRLHPLINIFQISAGDADGLRIRAGRRCAGHIDRYSSIGLQFRFAVLGDF